MTCPAKPSPCPLMDRPMFYFLSTADIKMTQKSFNFARKFSLPLYFVSAADGTNVVKVMVDCRGSVVRLVKARWRRDQGSCKEKGWPQEWRRGQRLQGPCVGNPEQ